VAQHTSCRLHFVTILEENHTARIGITSHVLTDSGGVPHALLNQTMVILRRKRARCHLDRYAPSGWKDLAGTATSGVLLLLLVDFVMDGHLPRARAHVATL
jgi:hypothetical protein